MNLPRNVLQSLLFASTLFLFINLQAQLPKAILRADSLIEHGEYSEAENKLQAAKASFSQDKNCKGLAWVATRLVRVNEYTGREQLNDQIVFEAIEAGRNCHIEQSAAFGTLIMLKGELALRKGDLEDAAAAFRSAAVILLKEKEFEQLTWTYTSMSMCKYVRTEVDSAEYYLDLAKRICKKQLPEDHVANSLLFELYSLVYMRQGANKMALENAFQNLIFYQKFGKSIPDDTILIARTYNNIASIYFLGAEYDQSSAYFKQAIYLFLNCTISDSIELGRALNNWGTVYSRIDSMPKAIACYSKAKRLLANPPSYNDARSLLFANVNLASYYIMQREFGMAERCLVNAQEVAIKWGISQESIYYQKGVLSRKQDQHHKALEDFRKSLAIDEKLFHFPMNEIGESQLAVGEEHQALGDLDSALIYFQKALGNYTYGFNSMDLFKNPSPEGYFPDWSVLYCLEKKGNILLNQGNQGQKDLKKIEMAFEAFRTGVLVLANFRKENRTPDSRMFLTATSRALFEGGLRAALDLYEATNDLKWYRAAFGFSEQSKGMTMLETQWEARAKGHGSLPAHLKAEEMQISRELAYYRGQVLQERAKAEKADSIKLQTWETELFELGRAHDAWERHVSENYPNYLRQKYPQVSITPEQVVAGLLDEEDVFIEFFCGESEIFTFLITKDGMHHFRQTFTDKIAGDLEQFVRSVSDFAFIHDSTAKNYQTFVASGTALYQTLLSAPLQFAKGKNILLVPDQHLHQIPFEALLTAAPNTQQIDFVGLPYLLHDYSVQYGFSAYLLMDAKYRAVQEGLKECLAFAPSYEQRQNEGAYGKISTLRDGNLALEGTQFEIETIAKLGVEGKFLFGKFATEDQFKVQADEFRILHFAMHGQADRNNPNHSNFRFSTLASDTCEDQKLYGYEILDLELPTELAVLSACETGVGKIQPGEGVMSLARNFLAVGARSVVSSLWKIDDKASAALMGRFYAKLIEGHSVTKALHLAKKETLGLADSRTAHPYYWAGIIGHGDAMPFDANKNWQWKWLAFFAIALFAVMAMLKFVVPAWRKRSL